MLRYIQSLVDEEKQPAEEDPRLMSRAAQDAWEHAVKNGTLAEIVWQLSPSQDLDNGHMVLTVIYGNTRYALGDLTTLTSKKLTVRHPDDLLKEFNTVFPRIKRVVVSLPFATLEGRESEWADPHMFERKLKDAVRCIWSLRYDCDFTIRHNWRPKRHQGLVYHCNEKSTTLEDDQYYAIRSVFIASDEGWEEGEWGRIEQGSLQTDDGNEWGLINGLEASQRKAFHIQRLVMLTVLLSVQTITWRKSGDSP
jgi:hypothetical protein